MRQIDNSTEQRERPAWVDHVIVEINTIERGILAVQECVLAAGVQLREKKLTAPADELNQAYHDIEHAWAHVTGVRRALRMTWPDGSAERA